MFASERFIFARVKNVDSAVTNAWFNLCSEHLCDETVAYLNLAAYHFKSPTTSSDSAMLLLWMVVGLRKSVALLG